MDALKKLFSQPAGSTDPQAAQQLGECIGKMPPVTDSLRSLGGGAAMLADKGREQFIVIACGRDAVPDWLNSFTGETVEANGLRLLLATPLGANVRALAALLPNALPRPLGTAASFGFGDRLGLATPGHVQALKPYADDILPIFCQQSIREMVRTERTAAQVMDDALLGAFRAGWDGPVSADADHLKTFDDVDVTAAEGYVFFTIDPSDHVDQQADDYSPGQLDERFQGLLNDKVESAAEFLTLYKGKSFTLETVEGVENATLDEISIKRAAVKYGRALAHIRSMTEHIDSAMAGKPWEIEISVDETEQPTSVQEHLFIALELQRRHVPVVSLAPRFVGRFEKGIDFRGDADELRRTMALHAAIARQYGPYKLSLHSGSDKLSVYPHLSRLTNGQFHIKTAGTSYLEALRVAARVEPDMFREIVAFCRDRYENDRATYHVSARLDTVPWSDALSTQELEQHYLSQDDGRQILHVTFGSVLTTRGSDGVPLFKDRLMDLLETNRSVYDTVIRSHFTNHLRPLKEGA